MALSAPARAGFIHDGAGARILSVLGAGASASASAADASAVAGVLAASDVLITWCANESAAERLLVRREGLLWRAPPGLILIDFSPISPRLMDAIARRCEIDGCRAHGAALSCSGGAPRVFVDASVGEDAIALEAVRSIAREIVTTGGAGTSKAMSIVECLIASVATVASAEAIAIAGGAGIEPSALIPLLLKGSGGNRALAERGARQAASDLESMHAGLALARETRHATVFGALAFAGFDGALRDRADERAGARDAELAA